MPRLDIWLVETGRFHSRQAAKRAIRDGMVTVDGRVAKPSTQVNGIESIDVSMESSDAPVGYDKLKRLDTFLGGSLVSAGDLVLDIGSSAGGFLRYLAERGAVAKGIEVSDRFLEPLTELSDTWPSISVLIADAFKTDPFNISSEEELDVMLVDVTTDPEGTLALVERFSALLKHNGRLIAAFKSKARPDIVSALTASMSMLGYTDVQTIVLDESRQEFHLAAVRL